MYKTSLHVSHGYVCCRCQNGFPNSVDKAVTDLSMKNYLLQVPVLRETPLAVYDCIYVSVSVQSSSTVLEQTCSSSFITPWFTSQVGFGVHNLDSFWKKLSQSLSPGAHQMCPARVINSPHWTDNVSESRPETGSNRVQDGNGWSRESDCLPWSKAPEPCTT